MMNWSNCLTSSPPATVPAARRLQNRRQYRQVPKNVWGSAAYRYLWTLPFHPFRRPRHPLQRKLQLEFNPQLKSTKESKGHRLPCFSLFRLQFLPGVGPLFLQLPILPRKISLYPIPILMIPRLCLPLPTGRFPASLLFCSLETTRHSHV